MEKNEKKKWSNEMLRRVTTESAFISALINCHSKFLVASTQLTEQFLS